MNSIRELLDRHCRYVYRICEVVDHIKNGGECIMKLQKSTLALEKVVMNGPSGGGVSDGKCTCKGGTVGTNPGAVEAVNIIS